MSLALHKADHIIRTADPRIDFDQQSFQVISDTAAQIVYQRYPASNPSNNILKFQTYQTPTNAISTKMFIQCRFRVTISGDTGDVNIPIYSQRTDAPRAFPLHAVTENAKIEINGAANDIRPQDITDALIRYTQNIQEMGIDMSGCPSQLDPYQQYSDWQRYGSGASPMAGVGESGTYPQNRGGFVIDIIAPAPTSTLAVLEFTTYEPVLISPLVWGHNDTKSLYGVKEFNITYNLSNSLTRVWSRINSSAVPANDNVVVQIVDNPELHMIAFTPKMIDRIKPVQIYPFAKIDVLNQDVAGGALVNAVAGSVANPTGAGSTSEFTFNSQSLGGVPSKIYLYAKKTTKTVYDTDTFMGLDKISVFFDGTQGIFANCSKNQLYNVSAANGLLNSYSDFSKYVGSVFCMDFTKGDIPLMDYLSAGSSKNLQFSFNCTVRNLSDTAARFTFFVVVVYDGTFSIDQFGAALFQRNIISAEDVISSYKTQKIPYQALDTFAYGGSFVGKLARVGRFAKKLGEKAIDTYEGLSDPIKEGINKVVKTGVSFVSPRIGEVLDEYGKEGYDKVKELMGRGYSEDQIYSMLMGSGMKKRKPIGGKKLTKADLKRLA